MTLGCDKVFDEAVTDPYVSQPGSASRTCPPANLKRDLWNAGNAAEASKAAPAWLGEPSLSRTIDIIGAGAILLITFPFLVILAILLKLDSTGPLFFVQQRIGRGGRSYPCMKFRTMCVDADAALHLHLIQSREARVEWQRDHKLRNDPRVTRLGVIVRKLSLDEFPQLINIIRGEMSLVGPRPIVRSEVPRYGRYFEEYCRVRPGLTGLWQVSGRNDVTYRRRVSMDCYYVRNRSLLFDMMILFRTVPVVLGAKGSY